MRDTHQTVTPPKLAARESVPADTHGTHRALNRLQQLDQHPHGGDHHGRGQGGQGGRLVPAVCTLGGTVQNGTPTRIGGGEP